MSTTEDFIVRALTRCRRLSAGADELHAMLAPILPYAGNDLDEVGLIERTATVALLKRFEQLQDLLARAARALASWEGSSGEMTQRDLQAVTGRIVDSASGKHLLHD